MVKDMTEGNIPRHLISYAIPLILGNLFQLTYNAVDSIIVGRFIGKEALAAVGTTSPVMNIIILGISGICIGASVLMSGFFGAKQEDMVKREMATTAVFGVYFSLIVVALGILVTKPLLKALYVPHEILDTASSYLRIIFLGAPFTFFYNAVASALKSVGDSRTPLKFLAFCSGLRDYLLRRDHSGGRGLIRSFVHCLCIPSDSSPSADMERIQGGQGAFETDSAVWKCYGSSAVLPAYWKASDTGSGKSHGGGCDGGL